MPPDRTPTVGWCWAKSWRCISMHGCWSMASTTPRRRHRSCAAAAPPITSVSAPNSASACSAQPDPSPLRGNPQSHRRYHHHGCSRAATPPNPSLQRSAPQGARPARAPWGRARVHADTARNSAAGRHARLAARGSDDRRAGPPARSTR